MSYLKRAKIEKDLKDAGIDVTIAQANPDLSEKESCYIVESVYERPNGKGKLRCNFWWPDDPDSLICFFKKMFFYK